MGLLFERKKEESARARSTQEIADVVVGKGEADGCCGDENVAVAAVAAEADVVDADRD